MENNKNLYSEEAVVSRMLVSKTAIIDAISILNAKDFSDQNLSTIFETIVSLHEQGDNVDVVTVSESLMAKKQFNAIGGADFLEKLVDSSASDSNIETYIDNVAAAALGRRFKAAINRAFNIINEGNSPMKDRVFEAEKQILEISRSFGQAGFKQAQNFVTDSRQDLMKNLEKNTMFTGLETGFAKLDKITSGFQNGDYIILGARPSVGKTAFALNLFLGIAEQCKKDIAFFSLEMPTSHLVNRMLSSRSQVNLQKIRSPKLLSKDEKDRIALAYEELHNLPLWINDNASFNIRELVASARKLWMDTEQNLSCIVIDYLQLIKSTRVNSSVVAEVSEISAELKKLARELNVPIIVLSQLSRRIENRENKRPYLSDLRDSGSIEQDADVVMFLHRDDYAKNQEGENQASASQSELIIAKHRNGETGFVNLVFDKTTGVFKE